MSEIDFKPNSHKFKEDLNSASDDRKKLEKVVKGNVKTRKRAAFVNLLMILSQKMLKTSNLTLFSMY